MKLFQFLGGVAFCAASSILFISCQKDETINPSNPDVENNVRLAGVVEEDPDVLARIPIIVSADFFKRNKDLSLAVLNARGGKPDNTAPTVSITSPSSGSTVSGSVQIRVNANDNIAVTLVSLSINGSVVTTTNSAPYILVWNSASVSNGSQSLVITARDAAGNSKTVSLPVTVNNTAPGDITNPTINITSPGSGSSVSGTVTIQANANDNVGVSSVSFSVDGTALGSDNSAPYSLAWNTANTPNGIRTLTATARDAAGNQSTMSIQVTINTIVLPPATLPSSYNLLMPPVGNQDGENSCVAFSTVYARSAEHFYRTNATSYSQASNIFSPEFVYNQIKVSDCRSGTAITTALSLFINTGVCSWGSMPYSAVNGCTIMPNANQLAEAASYKITAYSSIQTADITALKTMIANKHPVIIMIAPDQSFTNAQPGFIWNSFVTSPGPSHSVVICGYDDTKHAFKIINSWGTGWGDAGYSWINYDFLPQSSFYYSYVIN